MDAINREGCLKPHACQAKGFGRICQSCNAKTLWLTRSKEASAKSAATKRARRHIPAAVATRKCHFKVGDVVQLKHGGPKGTVIEDNREWLIENRSVNVAFFTSDGGLETHDLPKAALRKVDEK